MSRIRTKEEAIARIGDGNLLVFSGMQLNRAPIALVKEIIRQKKKDLRLVGTPNPLPINMLIKEGCVAEAITAFNGFSYEGGFVISPAWRKAIEQQKIKYRETDASEIVQGLRASAMGLPFMPMVSMEGSDYCKVNKYRKVSFGGEDVFIAEALRPDYAIIHAHAADKKGNIFVDGALNDELLANASRKVIASVERIADRLDKVTIPYFLVESVVEIPGGAKPTACAGEYDYDVDSIEGMVKG
ncbi:CoA transferase subunit A [Candidatus Woesearchaeota archaeon]|nr:CoA transferase subunit A [Candidatus Woesearchaeota archaeon]